MKLSETETNQIVKLYAEHENLWNPKHFHYKVKQERITSYYQILDDFKTITGHTLNVRELKNKIKTLRCTYILELERIMKRARKGGTYKTNIKWFGDMHRCLKSVAKTKRMDSAVLDSIVFEDTVQEVAESNDIVMIVYM